MSGCGRVRLLAAFCPAPGRARGGSASRCPVPLRNATELLRLELRGAATCSCTNRRQLRIQSGCLARCKGEPNVEATDLAVDIGAR